MKKETIPENKSKLEHVFSKALTPFEEFIHKETTGGMLLMLCAMIALAIANFGYYEEYKHFLHTHFSIGFGDWVLEKTLHHWINDGLMALFFFLVGLEIKREVLVGELSDIRQASLPIIAAVGGMVIPAAIYASINYSGDGAAGWGIPMATDIAFAVGVLVLLGTKAPKALLTFLVALAIVDDLGAVLVIAVFYTESLHYGALSAAGVLFLLLIAMNMVGVRRPIPYCIVGALLWFAMLKSGIHATLAGVLTALAIPARPRFHPKQFSNYMRSLMDRFDKNHKPDVHIMNNSEQQTVLQAFETGVHSVETPLQRMEHSLHTPVAFLIIPIFALANAGVPIHLDGIGDTLMHPVTLGVIAGLILGKFLGITGFCWLAIKLGIGQLPAGVRFSQLAAVSLLAGIGFTMSIFIAELAFAGQTEMLLMAKTGILFASLLAGVVGYLWLFALSKKS